MAVKPALWLVIVIVGGIAVWFIGMSLNEFLSNLDSLNPWYLMGIGIIVSTIGMVQWEPINYLLNQSAYRAVPYNYDGAVMTVGGFDGVMTHSARQRAYWSYQPGGWSPPAGDDALDLIADANANSAGFVPGPGQLAAVICQDGTSYQTVFLEIDP